MDQDSEGKKNQAVLVGGKVMKAAILILFVLVLTAIAGILYVIFVHLALKREDFEEWEVDDKIEDDINNLIL